MGYAHPFSASIRFQGRFGGWRRAWVGFPAMKSCSFQAEQAGWYWIPGVRNLTVSGVQPVMAKDRAERELLQMMRYGSRFANALLKLQQGGFEPDIVYAHPDGMQFSRRIFFLRRSMPCMRNGITQKGQLHLFHARSGPARRGVAQSRVRNLCQLNALAECDLVVTASSWQKKQYPRQIANIFT